jgi:N-acetylglucosaminyl-diphospho-decaprenol L-rhamnosyltransferase
VIERDFPQVLLMRSDANLGFARACNRAADLVDSDYILFLNPDAAIAPGCVDALLDLAERRRGGGLYGGRALDARGEFDPRSCWGRPTLWSMFCFATGLSSAFPKSERFNPEGIGGWRRDTEREVDVISGCLLLVRRDVWTQLGGFDERFFMYGEDVDLGVRAYRIGCRPAITPRAVVQHEVGGSSLAADKELMLFRGKASLVRTLWTGPSQRLAVGLLLAGVGLRALAGGWAGRLLPANGGVERTQAGIWAQLWRRRAEWRRGWVAGAA